MKRSWIFLRFIVIFLLISFFCISGRVFTENAAAKTGENTSSSSNGKRKKTCTIELIGRSGKVLVKKKIKAGKNYTLPCMKDEPNYTLQGWDTQKGKNRDPKYYTGQTINICKNTKLYGVYYKNSSMENLSLNGIEALDKNKYSCALIIGASSTCKLQDCLKALDKDYSQNRDEYFMARTALRLTHFVSNKYHSTSLQQLKTVVMEKSAISDKPVAVIICLGRNDVRKYDVVDVLVRFVNGLKTIADELQDCHVKLFLESLWPINDAICTHKSQARILQFNKGLSCFLPPEYTLIDMYGWMMKNGYSYRDNPKESNDGQHFSTRTYKRMHSYRMQVVNQSLVEPNQDGQT